MYSWRIVAEGGTKGWIFRFKMYGRTRDAGLGAYPAISLARARVRAFEYRALVADGVDVSELRIAEQSLEAVFLELTETPRPEGPPS